MADDFTMSSRELLVLLEELPESSKFKQARDRTFRVVEILTGEHKGTLLLAAAAGPIEPVAISNVDNTTTVIPTDDLDVIAEFVDWTHDRKIAARAVRETAALRVELRPPGAGYDPDFTGVLEPLQQILADRKKRAAAENLAGAKKLIRKGLFAKDGEPKS